MRSRNRDWLARELAEGRHMPLARVVKQATLPPGRWREKAYAAAAVEFLFPDGEAQTWTALFQAAGRGEAIDPSWLRRHSPALAGRNPEGAWREHLAERARTRTIAAWSDRGLQLEDRLLQALNARPQELVSGLPAGVPQELFARDLIAYRSESWTAAVAAALSMRVQSLGLGASPALQEVLASYAAFFDLLESPPEEKVPWWRRGRRGTEKPRPPDDATWQIALNQLWRRAEQRHQAFLENLQARKRYVDGFDRPEPGGLGEAAPSRLDVPRTRWQRYVDEVEERLGGTTLP